MTEEQTQETKDQAAVAESASYAGMMRRVESIIQSVGDEQLDLDQLVKHVEEGYGLIQQMQQRLQDAKGKIETLQQSFEKEPS